MVEILKAADARKISDISMADNQKITYFFNWVRTEAEHGNTSGMYYYSSEVGDFNEEEWDFIKGLGYSIVWSRPLSGYKVSWD